MAAAVDVADDDSDHLARGILHTAGCCHGMRGQSRCLYSEREKDEETLRMERTVKLAKLVREYYVGLRAHPDIFSGAPEKTLPPLVATRKYDVLVFGAQTRRPGFM